MHIYKWTDLKTRNINEIPGLEKNLLAFKIKIFEPIHKSNYETSFDANCDCEIFSSDQNYVSHFIHAY